MATPPASGGDVFGHAAVSYLGEGLRDIEGAEEWAGNRVDVPRWGLMTWEIFGVFKVSQAEVDYRAKVVLVEPL